MEKYDYNIMSVIKIINDQHEVGYLRNPDGDSTLYERPF